MPHVVIEYSDNVSKEIISDDILPSVHNVMLTCGLFSPDAVKSRAYPALDFLVGTKDKSGKFVHVSVAILSGRTIEQRKELSHNLIDVLKDKLTGINSITVEIRELENDIYRKVSTT